MKMKKIFILIFVLSLFLLVIYISSDIFFRPQPIIPPNSDVEVFMVSRRSEVGAMPEDITKTMDLEEVVIILSGYYTRRTFDNPFPTMGDDIWEIWLSRGSDHVNIVVGGRTNVLYRSGNDTILYEIINWESLMHELQMLKSLQRRQISPTT